MHDRQEDIVIIEQVLQGQQAAYATLVNKYQQYVFTLVLRYINNRETAEELAQDVFVKAYRCLADFKGQSKFSTWLYTIVHTTCLSHLRKKAGNSILIEQDKLAALSDEYNPAQQPSDMLEQKTQKQLLANAMKQLPESDAELLTLYYQAEQSVNEIGVILGLTESNVKIRLLRARQKLKEVLETRYNIKTPNP